jgi:hypothetical protein
MDRLERRRQFILAPRRLSEYQSWQTTTVGPYTLHVHPELNLLQHAHRDGEITLLGYVIDPHHPEFGDREILSELATKLGQASELYEHIDAYGGRFVLMVRFGDTLLLVSDPGGLRQIFFTDDSVEETFVASQPGPIAEQLGLPFDERAAEVVKSCQTVGNDQYWWPGERTPYVGIRHLMPNHSLTLPRRSVARFWPRKPLRALPVDEAAAQAGPLLRGLIEGAARRFPLAIPVTAGLDSRTLFAASRGVHEQVYYYTLVIYSLTQDSADIRVPGRLLRRLGISHHVLSSDRSVPEEFKRRHERSAFTPHAPWGVMAYVLQCELPPGCVVVNGVASEIARCFYHSDTYPSMALDGATLASFANMRDNAIAIPEFERWLPDASLVEDKYGVRILDLFYWEQKVGNWAAMAQAEFDIVHETFTPFGCRELLTILLSVDREFRRGPKYTLYRRIIRNLWPEALGVPINPQPLGMRLKSSLRELLKKAHLHGIARHMMHRLTG